MAVEKFRFQADLTISKFLTFLIFEASFCLQMALKTFLRTFYPLAKEIDWFGVSEKNFDFRFSFFDFRFSIFDFRFSFFDFVKEFISRLLIFAFRFSILFFWFRFARGENKLKTDRVPKFNGNLESFLLCFPEINEKFIRENKLKTDRVPKVEKGKFWVILIVFPVKKHLFGKTN